MDDYREANRANWDERAPAHARSPDYSFDRFLADPEFLSDVVRFDLPRLGDVRGLRGVHLQCHIGTDTISLARLGARMSGLDFSGEAVAQARQLAEQVGADVEFFQADVYDAPTVLEPEAFDLVYTGVGALCWLPRIRQWAEVVTALLKPGGRLFLREGHPMLWSLRDSREDRLLVVEEPYFETEAPVVWEGGGTYVETDVEFEIRASYSWNHGLGEIVTALFDVGLELTMLVEHDSAPWEALSGHMEKLDNGEFRLAERPERLPQTYTLQAVKRGARA
jgi:SAM-dependent methyltransferase